MTAGDALLPQCAPALSAGAALSAHDAAAPAAHERLRACVGGDLRRTNAGAKAAAAHGRRSPNGTQPASVLSGPAPASLGQSSGAGRSKAPGRKMRPGASAVSSSSPVLCRQGRSAQLGRRRFCPFAASAASRPPSRRYVSGAAPVFMRTSAGRTGSYRSPSGTRLRPRCPDPDCAGRSGRQSRR